MEILGKLDTNKRERKRAIRQGGLGRELCRLKNTRILSIKGRPVKPQCKLLLVEHVCCTVHCTSPGTPVLLNS